MDTYNISNRYTVPSVSSLSLISTLRMWNFSFSLKSPVGYVTEDLLMFGLHRMIRPSNKNTCLSVGFPFACFIRTPSGKCQHMLKCTHEGIRKKNLFVLFEILFSTFHNLIVFIYVCIWLVQDNITGIWNSTSNIM